MCRTPISHSRPSLTTKPLEPRVGRVWELEEEELISYSTRWLSSSTERAGQHRVGRCIGLVWPLTWFKLEGHEEENETRSQLAMKTQ